MEYAYTRSPPVVLEMLIESLVKFTVVVTDLFEERLETMGVDASKTKEVLPSKLVAPELTATINSPALFNCPIETLPVFTTVTNPRRDVNPSVEDVIPDWKFNMVPPLSETRKSPFTSKVRVGIRLMPTCPNTYRFPETSRRSFEWLEVEVPIPIQFFDKSP
jgi:hypothetical protein